MREPLSVPLLPTKLTPPELPGVLVGRPELWKRIDDGAAVRAVVASAGYGKTVLLREWVDSGPRAAVAWYSLDGLDANPACFWRHVVAALTAAAETGPEPGALLDERGPSDPAFLHALVHALLDGGREVVLVLDDLHHLQDRAALDGLALLVDRAGPQLRLAFSARTWPALPLARWRLQGKLTELGEDDLRFDLAHAAGLLAGYHCPPLADGEVADLVDRADGWVAGLQLAILASPQDPAQTLVDPSARGAAIGPYLVEEVVGRLADDERRAATWLSVLDEFDEGLAADLLGDADAVPLVRALDAGRLLVVRVAAARPTYRFHHLLRDLLRDQLRRHDPVRWEQLHRRAAELAAARGAIDEAFGHLLAVDDLPAAVELVVRPALRLSDAGWGRQFRRWFERLPGELDVDEPELLLEFAFAAFMAGRLDMARRWLDRAADRLPADDPRVGLRRLAIALAEGDLPGIDAALAALPDVLERAGAGAFELRLHTTAARAHLLAGRSGAAEVALARAESGAADEFALAVAVPAIRARLLASAGDVARAEALARSALDASLRLGGDGHPAGLEAHLARTAAAIGAARASEAAAALECLLDVVEVVDYPYSRAHAAALAIELSALQRGWAATAGLLPDLEAQAGWHPGEAFAGVLTGPRVRALVAAGRLDEAHELLATAPRGPERTVLEATALLAARRYDQVVRRLAERDGWPAALDIEALVLMALASTGADGDAALRRAVERAQVLGLWWPFVDRGPDLPRLVRRLPDELRLALAAVPGAAEPDRWPNRTGTVRRWAEPLTPRERDLLALLPTHLSNAAIGERLFVSVNTVKTNLRSLYRKLGTSSRAEAVAVARGLGLLPGERHDG